ncbi:ATPase [Caballeronia sp. LZ029]|uniref:ATPase n=1 Tax=Caballeronia sp. LZ029 TaxID=3038564 RepID=UPI00285AEB7F|nr:ATPase [Caballeronia sp. LZ029]MDR5745839.1 ATPase [Caballeronia sp. LZ029]
MKRLRGLALALLSGILISGCGGADSGTDALSSASKTSAEQSAAQDKATAKGYALSTVIWDRVPIGVCWDLNNADFARYSSERNWTRGAVEETWEQHSGVEFSGWQQCTNDPTFYGIRISVEDIAGSAPHTWGLGATLNNAPGGMALNFTFNNWSPSCQGREEYCIRRVAAHEFGHALGFAHEQNRADTPSSCIEPAQGTSGDTTIGEWDLASVMNYCNPKWNGDGKLSATDIEMAQKFYGPPVPKETIYTLTRAQAPAQVIAYDFSTHAVKASIDLTLTGDYKQVDQMFASADGKRLHVLLERSTTSIDLATIDTATNAIIRVTPIAPLLTTFTGYYLQPAYDGKQVYVSNKNRIAVVDTDSGQLVKNIVVPEGYNVRQVRTAKDDSGTIYALTYVVSGAKMQVLRIDTTSGSIVRAYPVGSGSSTVNNEFAVTPDAKKAYFVGFTSFTGEGSLTELDLTNGNTRVLADLPEKKPRFLTTISNNEILFGDDNYTSPSPIIIYNAMSGNKTNLMATSNLLGYLQYEPRTKSILLERNGNWSVNQLQPQADGSYKNVNLGLKSFSSGPAYGGVAPFVFISR